MKVNELMIGDYVKDSRNGNILKVYGIHDGGISVLLPNKEIAAYYESILEPIPLVRVHLVKNGFKAIYEDDSVFIYEDGFEVRIDIDGGDTDLGLKPIIFMNINFAEKFCGKEIFYLHELQQGMRYFGIEKEIKL